jgi:hypothetical protein
MRFETTIRELRRCMIYFEGILELNPDFTLVSQMNDCV